MSPLHPGSPFGVQWYRIEDTLGYPILQLPDPLPNTRVFPIATVNMTLPYRDINVQAAGEPQG